MVVPIRLAAMKHLFLVKTLTNIFTFTEISIFSSYISLVWHARLAHVEVRGQCAQTVSLLPLHGLQRSNSGCQVTIIHWAILLAQIILS